MIVRILRAAVAGAVAWWVGLMGLFGSLQGILGNPALQSAKMMQIYDMQPPPRIAVDLWLLPAGMFAVALLQAIVFAYIRPALPRPVLARGVAFAAIAWALFVPWFEFYLPWNLMLEPNLLVLVEMACWAGVMLLVGLGISVAFGQPGTRGPSGL